jgi:DNA-binding LacI/PurR family transcriptional regulator
MSQTYPKKVPSAGAQRVRIHDVARQCGLSITTVSQALNLRADQCRVSSETRTLVQRVARELGYQPSRAARALAKGRSYTVGILAWSLVPKGIYSEMISVIAEVLRTRGYHLLLAHLGDRVDVWGQNLLGEQMDGCLVLNNLPTDLRSILAEAHLPTVLVNVESDLNLPQVLVDDAAGMRQLTEHLLHLGHRRIAFYRAPAWAGAPVGYIPHYSVREREQAFLKTMQAAGCGASATVHEGKIEAYAQQVIAAAPEGRPTAIIAYSHIEALPLMRMLWERGLQVPRDLSLATFNDIEFVADVIPPLTAVAIPNEELGRQAAQLLLEQLDAPPLPPGSHPTPARRVVLPERLVVRASTQARLATAPA